MEFLALLVGLAGLWLGTEATIRGAVSIADRLGVSEFIIGVAILSIGSDLPELAIAVDAAIKNFGGGNASDLVVGSALGSDLGQIGFVLGVAALFGHLTLSNKIIYQHGVFLLGSLILLGLFGLDGAVSRTEGVSLVVVYGIYLILVFTDSATFNDDDQDGDIASFGASILYLVVGLAIVIGSAELTVRSATDLAVSYGIEQSFIAIIIIGLGSSLPELSISLAAILKKRAHLSVGNLVGSNIFDTLIPVGVAAAIANLDFAPKMLRFELPFLFALTVLVLFLFIRKHGIRKREGSVVLAIYLVYAAIKLATAGA